MANLPSPELLDPVGERMNALNRPSMQEDDFAALRDAAMEDKPRKGLKTRMQKRFGSLTDLASLGQASSGHSGDDQLVKAVMETGGGDNAALARKIHARYDAAGVRQPSVEVRFDNLCASTFVPEGSSDDLFTVGMDLKYKVLGAVAAAARIQPPMQEVKILRNVSGVLKPGRITLVLGPPGGGKSMLMKALSGRAPVPITGDVTYNGHTFEEFNATRTARYVDQFDLHNPSLTVRETLTFSARCQGPGYNKSMLEHLEKREQELGIKPDPQIAELMSGLHHSEDPSANVALTLQLLSLVNCADTVVGDGMIRGVSGGEKKRVTSGEVMVGPSKLLFMDEISTGLDSASTFTIVQSLANWAHATDSTIVVALLQPEPQVYDLFDDIMLVAGGRILFHGERGAVEPWFSSLGFECGDRKAVADFLQELVSRKDQPALRTDPSRFEPSVDFVPSAAFAAAFTRSDVYARTRAVLDKPFDKSKSHPAALMRSRYGIPTWDAIKALVWRESILVTRNKQAQKYRYIQMAVLALSLSFLFLRDQVTNNDSLRNAANGLSAIFFSMAYMQFLGLAECAETMMRLPVFYKQKFNLFFPGWSYAVPFAIVKIPIMFLEVTFWSVTTYWIVGFEASAGRFFTYWATLLLLQMYSSSLYRLIGTTVRAVVFGTSVAVIVMLVTFIGSGFVLLRPQIPDWWIWMFWVSPLQYALTGLANNEFLGESYPVTDPATGTTLGDDLLTSYGFLTGNKWRWIAPLVLIAWSVGLNLLNFAALAFLPPPAMPPPAPPLAEEDWVLSDDPAAKEAREVAVALPPPAPDADEPAKKSLTFPFQPITLAFHDLHYYVPSPSGHGELELLKGITGVFRPGVLTALMGASGAGKTTLMDVLADRKNTGRITGDVKVNGFDKNPDTFARVMGYCEQFDTHSAGATVEESVRLSAMLRLSKDIGPEKMEEFVRQTMDIVELDSIAGQIVGVPGLFGLSGEQFKRLTIAVELVANPAIIFMDEPTSGLDARSAQIVMRVVRNIVDSNRTIVCTIHQPSTEIFLHFDELLLLKRGGFPIFYGALGADSANLVEYFSSVPNTVKLNPHYNPATWMLEATNQSEEERIGVDFGELWQQRQGPEAKREFDVHSRTPEGAAEVSFPNTYAQGRFFQYKALLQRYVRSYWRSPPYNTTRMIITVLAALILGSFYWSRGDNYGSQNDVTAILGALFITVMFNGLINFQMIIPQFFFERPVMYRERASRMYAVFPWVQAMVDVEVPWIAVQSMLFALVAYFMIHFEVDAGKFFFFWLVLFLMCLIMCYLGMVMVAVSANLMMGVTFGATILGLWFAFAGFMIPRPEMPPWWVWFIYITPPGWALYAITVDQLGDKTNLIETFSSEFPIPVSEYIERTFDYDTDLKWMAVGILVAFVFVLRLVLVIATKYLKFGSK